MLTMGGQILFILGGVIRGKFLRGSIAPPRSGQVINICVEKTVTKKLSLGKSKNLSGERDPPHHTRKMAPTWREKTAQIENMPPIVKKKPDGFFIHAAPTRRTPIFVPPPLRASIITPPLTLFHFHLFDRVRKKLTKIKQKTHFSVSFT